MQIAGLEKLINGIVFSVLGIGVIIKSKSFAKVCRENKVRLLGEARYDDISEVIAKFLLILIGVVFILGSFLQAYQHITP